MKLNANDLSFVSSLPLLRLRQSRSPSTRTLKQQRSLRRRHPRTRQRWRKRRRKKRNQRPRRWVVDMRVGKCLFLFLPLKMSKIELVSLLLVLVGGEDCVGLGADERHQAHLAASGQGGGGG